MGSCKRNAVRIHADIIDGPPVDTDRSNLPIYQLRAATKAIVQTLADSIEIPIQATVALYRRIAETMNRLYARLPPIPLQQRNAAALRAQIDRYNRRKVSKHRG